MSTPPAAPGAPASAALKALREALAAVAPEADLSGLVPDRPLREQIDLDSLDWVNVWAEAQQRLGAGDAAWAPGPQATLDSLVEGLVGAAGPPTASTSPPASPSSAGRAADGPASPAADGLQGGAIVLRPLRADDVALEAEFVRRLSDESRYTRYMGTLRELPPDKLAFLSRADPSCQVAFGALAQASAAATPERLVGVARYVVDADGRGCEFAVTVDDALQGSGLAGRLMHALVARARVNGLARMEGLILASNRPMRHFARQLGFRVTPLPDDPLTVRAVLDL